MDSFKVLAELILILCISQTGFGLGSKCYSCKSHINGTCGSAFDDFKSNMKGVCVVDEWICAKVVFVNVYGQQEITRGCALSNYCDENKDLYIDCKLCSKNYCNSSVNALPNYTAIIIVVIAVALNKLTLF